MIALGRVDAVPDCPALDGCHGATSTLAKIYHFHGHPLSEEMLLGLGAGMGFIYWRMKLRMKLPAARPEGPECPRDARSARGNNR